MPTPCCCFTQGAGLTDQLQSQVFVGARLFGVFVQEHDGASDPAVLQSLLTDAGQLQGHTVTQTHTHTEYHTEKILHCE